MTISTPPTDRTIPAAKRSRGFTLAEVMIAATLSTMILAGVLSAYLTLGRTAYSAAAYSELDAEMRRGLARFALDARAASGIQWNSSQSVTLTVPGTGGGTFTYGYDADPSSRTYRSFFRMAGNASSTAGKVALIREISPDFTFERYKLSQDGVIDNAASNDLETKLLGIRIASSRSGVTVPGASQNSTSARFILRNKRVGS